MKALDRVLEAEARAREIRQKAQEDARLILEKAQEEGERLLLDIDEAYAGERAACRERLVKELAHLEAKSVGDAEIQVLALKKGAKQKQEAAAEAMLALIAADAE